jgi:hypothetical protein
MNEEKVDLHNTAEVRSLPPIMLYKPSTRYVGLLSNFVSQLVFHASEIQVADKNVFKVLRLEPEPESLLGK